MSKLRGCPAAPWRKAIFRSGRGRRGGARWGAGGCWRGRVSAAEISLARADLLAGAQSAAEYQKLLAGHEKIPEAEEGLGLLALREHRASEAHEYFAAAASSPEGVTRPSSRGRSYSAGAAAAGGRACASLVRSRKLHTGNTAAISSCTKRFASTGCIFQIVGQGESTSTKENPSPLTWFSTARLTTLAACMICLLLPSETRSM